MNIHSQWGKDCIKEQQLRLWILESKCVMKLQYLDFNPTVICYKQNLMGTPFDGCFGGIVGGLQQESNFIWISALMSTGLTFLALFAFAAKFISVSASVHRLDSVSVSFMVHLLQFHCSIQLFYLLLLIAFCDSYILSSHVCSPKPISTCSWAYASNIWYILVRDSLHFGSQLICFPHRCAVLIIHFLLECI